jgi:hypothetical protein
MLAARLPDDDCQQIDTSALPVKHTSAVRGPGGWTGPGNGLAARFGRDAAHAGPRPFEWHATAGEILEKVRRGRAALERIAS